MVVAIKRLTLDFMAYKFSIPGYIYRLQTFGSKHPRVCRASSVIRRGVARVCRAKILECSACKAVGGGRIIIRPPFPGEISYLSDG